MYEFIYDMDMYTYGMMNNCPYSYFDNARNNFISWQNYRNKHDIPNFYNDPNFCIYYTNRLFKSRVECFHKVLEDISTNSLVKDAMMKIDQITSFGCGPGSEIAAYISFMRSHWNMNKNLYFTAVDKIASWKNMIDVVCGVYDNIDIDFQVDLFNESYLWKNQPYGICIMSYPESFNFGNIWSFMKNYFHLIIIVDQNIYMLHDRFRQAGFTLVRFEYKGSKTYAFFLSDRDIRQTIRFRSYNYTNTLNNYANIQPNNNTNNTYNYTKELTNSITNNVEESMDISIKTEEFQNNESIVGYILDLCNNNIVKFSFLLVCLGIVYKFV